MVNNKHRTRIFVDCHVFDEISQGTTTYLKGLYQELIKNQNHFFYLAAFDITNLEQVFGNQPNVIYLKYSTNNKLIRLLINIPFLTKKHKINYAHFQYIVPPIKTCKYIVTIHDILFLDFPEYFPLSYRIQKKILFYLSSKYSDIVLTVSEYSKTQIQHHFRINKIYITSNAVDPSFFDEYNKLEIEQNVKERFKLSNYWIFVSRWEPRKNHDRLLKVFVENEYYKNYYLVFIGEKAITNKQYNFYFESLNKTIQERIIVLNKINFSDLLLLTRGAKLSIYPSIAEGFGIPPLESIAAQIPTICSNTTAMSDFNFIGNCLFNPLEISDFKEKVEIGLKDDNLVQKKEFVKQKYNWKVAAAQMEKLIKNI